MKRSGLVILAAVLTIIVLFLFPRKEILVPAMDITVRSAEPGGVSKLEVSRSWNHFLGPGWTASVAKPDSMGNVHFPEVSRRVPLAVKAFYTIVSPIFDHQYPGFAGSINARDANNYRIWQRVDFDDRNCCPSEVVVIMHDPGDELDSSFTFGNITPNN